MFGEARKKRPPYLSLPSFAVFPLSASGSPSLFPFAVFFFAPERKREGGEGGAGGRGRNKKRKRETTHRLFRQLANFLRRAHPPVVVAF